MILSIHSISTMLIENLSPAMLENFRSIFLNPRKVEHLPRILMAFRMWLTYLRRPTQSG